jgi:UTP--glucose-1-phosphate uridylyltransferase
MARHIVGNEPFVLLLPDDIFQPEAHVLSRTIEVGQQYDGGVIAVKRVPREETSRYGIVQSRPVADRIHRIDGLVEKPAVEQAPSDLAIMGRYLLPPGIFEVLEKTLPGKKCPECGNKSLIRKDGCDFCTDCGFTGACG